MWWQAAEEDANVEESGSEDGVYLFKPHTSYISGLRRACNFSHALPQEPQCGHRFFPVMLPK